MAVRLGGGEDGDPRRGRRKPAAKLRVEMKSPKSPDEGKTCDSSGNNIGLLGTESRLELRGVATRIGRLGCAGQRRNDSTEWRGEIFVTAR